jgi:hypothetical protein
VALFALGVLPLRLGHMLLDRALALVMVHFNRRLITIEPALDGWVRVMMRHPVAVRWIARLAVGVAARRRHVVCSMRFHLLASLALDVGFIEGRTLCAMRHVNHAIGHAARHAVVLRMFFTAASLADHCIGVASRALARVDRGLSIASMLANSLSIL